MAVSQTQDPFKQNKADLQPRDLSGKFSKLDPPLVSFSVTNPLTYIRKWWKAVMDGEGIDIRLKIHPFTAVAIVLAVGGVSFGLGRASLWGQVTKYVPMLATPSPVPSPSPSTWREAAFAGTLQVQSKRYFLLTSESQALLLELPADVDPSKWIGKRILASGMFDASLMVLKVKEASDLELVTEVKSLPTAVPTPTPEATPTPLPPNP